MRTVLVVIAVVAVWFAVAFLLGPLVGRVLKFGHIRPVGGPPARPTPPAPSAGEPSAAAEPEPEPEHHHAPEPRSSPESDRDPADDQ